MSEDRANGGVPLRGRRHRRADGYTRRCAALNVRGEPCGASALRDSEPPVCSAHADPKAHREKARRGGKRSGARRRAQAEPRPSLKTAPGVSLQDVLRVCGEALTATFEHDGSPDWSARLAAAGTLLLAFPGYRSRSPEEVRALLEDSLPEQIKGQRGWNEQVHPDAVYAALRREWDALQFRADPVARLYRVAQYPPHLIAPWEDARKVQRTRPGARPLDELPQLPDGSYALPRPDDVPLIVPVGEIG